MTRGPERDVKRKDVLATIEPGIPVTATTIQDNHFDCHPDTVMNRLKELHKLGEIETKSLGERARVWWVPAPDTAVDKSLVNDEMFRSAKDPGILRVMADYLNNDTEPVTSGEIAERVDDSPDIIYNRLRKLDERGWIESLKVGSTAKVWWLNKDKLKSESDTGSEDDVDSTVGVNTEPNAEPGDYNNPPSGSGSDNHIAVKELTDHFDELVKKDDSEHVDNVQTLLNALLNITKNLSDEEQSQTSLTLSEALKDHIREVAGKTEAEGVEGIQTLEEALIHILDNPYDEKKSLTGYEKTLEEPIKVSRKTLQKLSGLRDWTGARDLEEAIRERANIERRDVGERPVDVSDW